MSERSSRAEAALQAARTLTAPWANGVATPEPDRLDVSVAATSLLAVVDALHSAHWGYLSAITGLDSGPATDALEVLYHFCAGAAVLTLRVRVSRATAGVPSLCALIPSASFFERELSEMFGVTIENAPNTDRLFLPDDWPVGVYPLRKDFVVAEG
jgi:Ni,Fe-hydrogenase III component G